MPSAPQGSKKVRCIPGARNSIRSQHPVIIRKARKLRVKSLSPFTRSQAGLLPFITVPTSPKGSFLSATLEPRTELPATFLSQDQYKFFLHAVCFLRIHLPKYTLRPIFFFRYRNISRCKPVSAALTDLRRNPPPYVMKSCLR